MISHISNAYMGQTNMRIAEKIKNKKIEVGQNRQLQALPGGGGSWNLRRLLNAYKTDVLHMFFYFQTKIEATFAALRYRAAPKKSSSLSFFLSFFLSFKK